MTPNDILDVILTALVWLGSLLGLLIVMALWAILLFVVAEEIVGVYREFRKPKDDSEEDIYE